MEKRCKNCQWWFAGECMDCDDFEEVGTVKKTDEPADIIKIIWRSDDDSGLDFRLATGPDFGCVHFKAKESEIK